MGRTDSSGNLILQAILFTLLIPGVAAGLLPYLISLGYGSSLELGQWHVIGVPFLVAGIILYLVSLILFLTRGGGTPAIWFTKRFRAVIGEEPVNLVRSSIYRLTRNPMYLGVVLTIFGQALWFDDFSYHLYGLIVWVIFHGVVVGIEEPHLKKKFGKAYEEYCRVTPRWLGSPADEDKPDKQRQANG